MSSIGAAADTESGPPVDPYVVRASARQSIVYSKAGVVKRLASPLTTGQLQMLLVEIEPGAGSGESGYSHAGEECGIVFEGILDLWIDGQKRTLGTGDSFRFPSTKTHRFHNPGTADSTSAGRVARALCSEAARSAARPMAWDPSAAAMRGSTLRARNAPIIPESASPLPPVASAGLPEADT